MSLPTTDIAPSLPSPPRVQAVQLHARLIYEDGKVVGLQSVPSEIQRDELDPSFLISDQLVAAHLMAHAEGIKDMFLSAGAAALYETAIQDSNQRRQHAIDRAIVARKQKEAELRAGQVSSDIGREKSQK